MEQQFRKWLIHKGYSETGAGYSYPRAIHKISEHYSDNINDNINIYTISDQSTISQIAADYSQAGQFSEFGYKKHSLYRAAMSRYSEFFIHNTDNLPSDAEDKSVENSNHEEVHEIPSSTFAYERDLQTTLCAQVSELFPGYRIFGGVSTGVEYSIGGRRIDVLLEHSESGDLLAVELKSGVADYKVFGQISMYIGLLEKQFEDINISGVIVAGTIEESLSNACSITDKVSLKMYRMNIELESV